MTLYKKMAREELNECSLLAAGAFYKNRISFR